MRTLGQISQKHSAKPINQNWKSSECPKQSHKPITSNLKVLEMFQPIFQTNKTKLDKTSKVILKSQPVIPIQILAIYSLSILSLLPIQLAKFIVDHFLL